MMIEAMSSLLSVAILILILAAIKLREYSKDRKLHDLVAWCVTQDPREHRCNMHLHDYIARAQIKGNLPQEYHIASDEWDAVKEILEHFKKELTEDYFTGRLWLIKSKYAIPGEEFFMYHLCTFLEKHQCDFAFIGHDMHKERISYKAYGSWGGQLYDATYSITDFAVTYHKLYYVSCLFCKGSKIYNPNSDHFLTTDNIKEILDTREIQISRC